MQAKPKSSFNKFIREQWKNAPIAFDGKLYKNFQVYDLRAHILRKCGNKCVKCNSLLEDNRDLLEARKFPMNVVPKMEPNYFWGKDIIETRELKEMPIHCDRCRSQHKRQN